MIDIPKAVLLHAVSHAWGNPHRDMDFLLEPIMLNTTIGNRGFFRLGDVSYPTPDGNHNWVLYEFPMATPKLVGLFSTTFGWRDMADIMKDESILIFPMLQRRMCVLKDVKLLHLEDGSLLIALKAETHKDLLRFSSVLQLKLYSNSYFAGEGTALGGVRSNSTVIATDNDTATFISDYNATGYEDKGTTMWFKNGFYIEKPAVSDVEVEDGLSYIWDSSGTKSFDVPLTSLKSFKSDRDGGAKYLILTPEFVNKDFIYHDDVTFMICSYDSDDKVIGVYYNRELPNDIRQVSQRDWALDVVKLNAIINENGINIPFNRAFVRVILREAVGSKLELEDGQYLSDLYNLEYSERATIMTSTAHGFSPWYASTLENSAFAKWISRDISDLDDASVRDVYNYYGMQDVLQLPTKVDSGWQLPEMAKEGCLVLNMNDQGHVISQTVFTSSTFGSGRYTPTDTAIKDIIVYCGEIATTASSLEASSERLGDTVDNFDEERYFRTNKNSKWTLARYKNDYVYDENLKVVNWTNIHLATEKFKRLSRYFTTRTMTVNYADIGKAISVFADGTTPSSGLPFGRIDVWIDGKRATHNLDYCFDGLKLYITSREYQDYSVSNKDTFELVFVAHGVPSDTENGDYGFIIKNMINHDNDFDLVNNRNFNLYVGGRRKSFDSVYLAEKYKGVSIIEFTSNVIKPWTEGVSYPGKTLVMQDNSIYLAPADGVTSTGIFQKESWIKIWTNSPYFCRGSNDKYVTFFAENNVLTTREVYKNSVLINGSKSIPADIGIVYELKPGTPIPSNLDGMNYNVSGCSNVISRFLTTQYSDGYVESKNTSKAIKAFLDSLTTQYKYEGAIFLSDQHKIVSLFLNKILTDLQSGKLVVGGSTFSDAYMNITLREYLRYLDIDPAKLSIKQKNYVTIFSHGLRGAITVSPSQASFLKKAAELYLDDQVVINRDFKIN